MDPRLDFLLKRYGVKLRLDQPIDHAAYLSRLPTHVELAVQAGLEGPELDQVVAIQLARLLLGHLDRLDKDGDTKLAEWRESLGCAARMLVTDALVERAEGEGWDAAQLAAAGGVTEQLAAARLEEHVFRRDLAPFLADGTRWADLLSALRHHAR